MLQVIVVMLAVLVRVASKMNYEIGVDNLRVLTRQFICNIIAWCLVHFCNAESDGAIISSA